MIIRKNMKEKVLTGFLWDLFLLFAQALFFGYAIVAVLKKLV